MSELAKRLREAIGNILGDVGGCRVDDATHNIGMSHKAWHELADTLEEAAAALSGVRVPEFTFNELLEFLEEQEDVMDGTDGPRPNPAMRLATDLRALAASKGER